jgi:vacuolar-type H+-ATPase subunit I/STV1
MRQRLLVVVLLTAVAAFARQESGQSNPRFTPIPSPGAVALSKPKPSQKQQATPPKPIPCSQRLKAQVNSNAELSNRIEALEKANASWQSLANALTAEREETASKTEEIFRKQEESIRQEEQSIQRERKAIKDSIERAATIGMLLSEVSGNYTIPGLGVCYVQVFESSRTIQLTNCH